MGGRNVSEGIFKSEALVFRTQNLTPIWRMVYGIIVAGMRRKFVRNALENGRSHRYNVIIHAMTPDWMSLRLVLFLLGERGRRMFKNSDLDPKSRHNDRRCPIEGGTH